MVANSPIPPGFVYLHDIAPDILQDIQYVTCDNFIGVPVDGYQAPSCILTLPAAIALKNLHRVIATQGLGLLVYDGYRPLRASLHFLRWSQDITDQKTKVAYYPNIDKKDFFKLGYVAHPSSHNRGSTVDLTLIDLKNKKPLDMGTPFDFMDPLSHPANTTVTSQQYQNRQLLKEKMYEFGFIGIDTEWWHFTLQNEPFPEQNFDFLIT
jgi:zinc D-Ala-D-Ala dipeptidase